MGGSAGTREGEQGATGWGVETNRGMRGREGERGLTQASLSLLAYLGTRAALQVLLLLQQG